MRESSAAVASCASLMDERGRADQFSGAVLIAWNGLPLMERAYGYACKGYGVRNHVDTLFNIGSMTKMFTAVSIVQLVEQEQLAFGDAISQYLPDFSSDIGSRVTIEHLLTHTSGMGSFWNASFEAARSSLRSVAAYMQLFIEDPLVFEPGEGFRYSNAGYIVLGAIIERVSGTSYDTYVREHIFEPAGMTRTGAWELDEDVPNRAVGYTAESDGDVRRDAHPRTNALALPAKGSPAGGSYSTVHDLLRFAQAIRTNQLLSDGLTCELLRPHVKMGLKGDAWYAYGFGCHQVGGLRIVGHNGGAPGVGAQLDIHIDTGYTMVMLSNYDASVSMTVTQPIRQLLTGMNEPAS